MIGEMTVYTSDVIPDGWMLCDGRLLDSLEYSDLFAVIGYTFGGHRGLFAIPDMLGRVAKGVWSGTPDVSRMGDGESIGVSGGSSQIAIGSHNLPPHNHEMQEHGLNTGVALTPGELPVTIPGVTVMQTGFNDSAHEPIDVNIPSVAVNYIIYTGVL